MLLCPLFGAAIVCAIAFGLRRLARRVSLPLALVIAHSLLILVAIALYPTGIFIADEVGFDDIYAAYLFVPGTHIYLAVGNLIVEPSGSLLFRLFSSHVASIFGIVVLPGVFGAIVGGIQWYLLGCGFEYLRSRRPRLA